MSTPVLADGILYGLSNKKRAIVAVDAATGLLKWATEGRTADQAAILDPAHVWFSRPPASWCWSGDHRQNTTKSARYTVADSATWACLSCCRTA